LGQLFSLHPQDRSARIAKIRRTQKMLRSRSEWSMIRVTLRRRHEIGRKPAGRVLSANSKIIWPKQPLWPPQTEPDLLASVE
jgi:hypothetical protein